MSYYFVEYARAKRAIRIVLILLGLVFLAAVLLRISVHDGHWETDLEQSPTAHVTRTQLADGSTQIVVSDPQRQTHAVIVKRAGGVIDMDITEPRHSPNHGQFIMGSTTIRNTVEGGRMHTVIHYSNGTPLVQLGLCFLFTVPMGLIVASVLGGVLAKENDGHLELAWTKPVSRESYALQAIAVDAGAIALSQVLALAVGFLAMLMFQAPRFSYEPNMGEHILAAFAAPIAWYALITAASASLKRGPGVVIGAGWFAAILIPSLGQGLQNAANVSPIAAWFYAIFKGLSYLDPIAYLTFSSHSNYLVPAWAAAWVLCALIAVYVALAVAQWRRVEA